MPMSATLLAVRTSVHSCVNRLKPARHSMAMSASLGIHPLHQKILRMLDGSEQRPSLTAEPLQVARIARDLLG
jgi:hypothetical protein